jgi:hypothetical protein
MFAHYIAAVYSTTRAVSRAAATCYTWMQVRTCPPSYQVPDTYFAHEKLDSGNELQGM